MQPGTGVKQRTLSEVGVKSIFNVGQTDHGAPPNNKTVDLVVVIRGVDHNYAYINERKEKSIGVCSSGSYPSSDRICPCPGI